MNTFMNQMANDMNYKYTENGGLAHKSTMSGLMDLFGMGAAYRSRTDADCVLLFMKAFKENEKLALKTLFWIRDARGGAGERRFFRVCMEWLAMHHANRIRPLLQYIPEFGRWDDLYIFADTPLESDAFLLMKNQIETDIMDVMSDKKNVGISLCAKWLKSENASSEETRKLAKKTRAYFSLSSKDYRKMLSKLREHIKVLEKLMSANRWEEIEFSKVPSKAGMIYRNAFARRDIIAERYKAFIKDKNTKVHADVLYPYEIVSKATKNYNWWSNKWGIDELEREALNKYWANLPDYLEGKDCSMMCVVDTSGSMTGSNAAAPINVAISLGLYCAERLGGPFANHYISFSSRPQLIETVGIDFVDKVQRIYQTNLCDNTNLEAVFDLLLKIGTTPGVKKSDVPKTIIVISDMEIDAMSRCNSSRWGNHDKWEGWTTKNANTMMEKMREKWSAAGLELPRLIYWNVDARHNTIIDSGDSVSFVSGMSPILFKQIITGKSGWDLFLETICADRYKVIK